MLISIEGTRSYGAQITALLTKAGYRVVDAPSPKRERGSAKNDHIDAVVAARGILHKTVDQLADARAGQTSATLQILLTARNSMTSERTRAINALNAILRTHALGIDARRAVNRPTIRTVAGWRPRKSDTSGLGHRAHRGDPARGADPGPRCRGRHQRTSNCWHWSPRTTPHCWTCPAWGRSVQQSS